MLDAQAQSASSYQLTPSAGAFTPLVGGTSVPAILHNDTVSGSLPIGFTFGFGSASYTSFRVFSNRLLGFGSSLTDAGAYASNTLIGTTLTGTSLPALAPFWTYLSGSTGTTAHHALSGTAPNRVLTMEWLDYKDLNGNADHYISFQVKLYETTNRVEYVYRKGLPGEAGDTTIGLKSTNGSFLSLADVSASPTTSSTNSYDRLNRPTTGQVYAFATPAAPLATTPALTAADVALFPNPTHAGFRVLVPAVAGATAVRADLLNALGQVVRQQAAALPAAGARFQVATADLSAGVYTLRLQVGATTLVKRAVFN